MKRAQVAAALALAVGRIAFGAQTAPLSGTAPLTLQGDLSAAMVSGIDHFLTLQTGLAGQSRESNWHRDFSSAKAYDRSVQPQRELLRKIIGATDERVLAPGLELVGSADHAALIAETELVTVHAVRWPVFHGVYAEGLWLRPKGAAFAKAIALPDADQTPEVISGLAPGLEPERQFARRLAENGCEVLVPVLVSRDDTFSGNARLRRFTNQPHREWIYRQAYELGRHVIGYEVQEVLAAVDFFSRGQTAGAPATAPKIGLVGYGEGGLVALYATALEPRLSATVVSGYFGPREQLWSEPIYRNVWGLLKDFGDAEIASLVAPRVLIVDPGPGPVITGPPKPREGRSGAAPGSLAAPGPESVKAEYDRARALLHLTNGPSAGPLRFIAASSRSLFGPVSEEALLLFLNGLGVSIQEARQVDNKPVKLSAHAGSPSERQARVVEGLAEHTQRIFRETEQARDARFWDKLRGKSKEEWADAVTPFRREFHTEVIGTFGVPDAPPNPRAREILQHEKWIGYEVVLDVYPDVFAWGYLLVPKSIAAGERRPVVVCQHGLEGVPADVVDENTQSKAYGYYKAFGARLADRGFVVFAPHNPYRGGDKFRVLQRKANPLGASLFSIIIAQHDRLLQWLSALPFVDPQRIGFYGLSYGGKTAMRVPAALPQYALSICSGDFNEWVRKNASIDSPVSYMFTGEYEMPEWDLGHTFNYAEMAALIAPRPFMVERGHSDTVGLDEWVAYEYAKVRRLYDRLEIGDRTEIEFFNGPHTINGEGTFRFLGDHLKWPGPSSGHE